LLKKPASQGGFMFSGVYTALITPFKNDKVDYESLEKLIEHQHKNAIVGIVPCANNRPVPYFVLQRA
jgi:4-hydroxy-tetrahydrodipicolinate synthase